MCFCSAVCRFSGWASCCCLLYFPIGSLMWRRTIWVGAFVFPFARFIYRRVEGRGALGAIRMVAAVIIGILFRISLLVMSLDMFL